MLTPQVESTNYRVGARIKGENNMKRTVLLIVVILCGCNSLGGESDTLAPARAGCARYWERFENLDKLPPPFGLPHVVAEIRQAVERNRPASGEAPVYMSVASEGSIDSHGRHQPDAQFVDPWGTAFQIEIAADATHAVSAGPDRQFGTTDDIRCPDSEAAKAPG